MAKSKSYFCLTPYKLIPENEVFANSDALILKIAVISKSYNKSQIANIPPYSQQ